MINSKEFFIKYGILSGILAGILLILIYTTLISHSSWNNNLKYSCEKVLEENESGVWSVGSPIEIKSPVSMKSGCFGARNRTNGEMFYVYITRVPTFYGPLGAVFTCSLDGQVTFHGYSSLHGRILTQINNSKYDIRLKRIMERIPDIVGLNPGVNND
ncbi:MAG: hypothetical protein MJ185_07950 [Treponema sp.]|nr:hypothetical protein [Treponema sp.]